MSTDYKNIKVKPDVFDELSDHKPDGVTWSRFEMMLLDAFRENDDGN